MFRPMWRLPLGLEVAPFPDGRPKERGMRVRESWESNPQNNRLCLFHSEAFLHRFEPFIIC